MPHIAQKIQVSQQPSSLDNIENDSEERDITSTGRI